MYSVRYRNIIFSLFSSLSPQVIVCRDVTVAEDISSPRQKETLYCDRVIRVIDPLEETEEELAAWTELNKWRKIAQLALEKYQLGKISKEKALSLIVTKNKKKYNLNANK